MTESTLLLTGLLAFGWLAFFIILILFVKQKNQLSHTAAETAVLQAQNEGLQARNSELESVQTELKELHGVQSQFQQLEEHYASLQEADRSKNLRIDALMGELSEARQQQAELSKSLEYETSQAEEKIQLLENAKAQLANEFKVLANQIFESKQVQFSEQSKQSVASVVKPMQEALSAFQQRVETVHKEDIEGRVSLSEQLKQLQQLNTQMTQEAQNLTQALKGDSKTQGNWGELVLERLLERSGLREGIEFEREKSFVNEAGKRQRPDVIINLPEQKHIVIDSKVSLTHYEQALNGEEDRQVQASLKQHLNSLKTHIDTLAVKRYEHLLNAPDFVLMFLPVEGAYLMAIEADPSIFERAFEKNVAVVTPTTLFTTLKTIEQLWRYERQSENTVKLIKRAAEVHDKFVGFVETFEKVGTQFETAHKTYQKARNQMIQGNGNLVRQAEMLKELAGKTKKEIPSHLLEEAEGQRIEQQA